MSVLSTAFAEHPILPHPSDAFLNKLRNNATQPNAYKAAADSYNPNGSHSIDGVVKLCTYYLATKNFVYLEKIKTIATGTFPNCYTHKEGLAEQAIAYDWIYNDLDATTRANFLRSIKTLSAAWQDNYVNQIRVSPYNDVGYIRLGWSIFAAAPVIYEDDPAGSAAYYNFA